MYIYMRKVRNEKLIKIDDDCFSTKLDIKTNNTNQ